MADKNIGMLPQVAQLDDESLMVVEQQGTAMKMTGRQFKDFGKTGVLEEVQGYVADAQEAAQEAVGAVRAVTDLTVSAQSLGAGEEATVEKTVQAGVFHLAFGLPRGEQGIPGPEGKTGPAGPKGEAGSGLKILGYYDTPAALEAAVPAPNAGDAYGVGAEPPYDIYIFDGVSLEWKNNGPLSGGGGVVPENVVTAEGGASLAFSAELGYAPQTVTFTDEEEPPLTAEDISYADGTVQEALDGLKSSVSNGKSLIASAITDKGVDTAQDASFAQMAANIGQISTGIDPSDATATPGDILAPKTAYTAAGKVEGIIPTLAGQTITPGTADQTIANGQYLGGTQVIKGDANLSPANIRQGVTLFGVAGAMTSEFKATLTVTADTGAVVTATHTNGTEVSALSTNGSVVLELPIEGTWTVTAVRGVAQYNSVVVEVSSSYSAELTAEVHIEYYGRTTDLSTARSVPAATSIGGYALFAGGGIGTTNGGTDVDAYDTYLTRKIPTPLSRGVYYLAAASVGNYALFAGGYYTSSGSNIVNAYNKDLVRSIPTALSAARYLLAGVSIGKFALFAGGTASDVDSSIVDAYDTSLTRTTPAVIVSPAKQLAASSNSNYAVIAGGKQTNGGNLSRTTAYNSSLTRETPTILSKARYQLSAARAGNYILFAGGRDGNTSGDSAIVDAYDLFLTRSTPEQLRGGRYGMGAATLNEYALFAAGYGYGLSYTGRADAFDPYLTKTNPNSCSSRESPAAASVGNFVILGGGTTGSTSSPRSAIVDAYQYV